MGEIVGFATAMVIGGYHWTREAFEELLREHEFGIEALMVAAAAGSIALGMWDEAAALVFLYGAAEGVEHYSYMRTRRSIRSLLDLAPRMAVLLEDGRGAGRSRRRSCSRASAFWCGPVRRWPPTASSQRGAPASTRPP